MLEKYWESLAGLPKGTISEKGEWKHLLLSEISGRTKDRIEIYCQNDMKKILQQLENAVI